MGKVGTIALGTVVIGTIAGVILSFAFGVTAATAGMPLLCALFGLVASTVLVLGYDAIRKRAAAPPPAAPAPASHAGPADKPETSKP